MMSKPASAANGENRERNMRAESNGGAPKGATKRLASELRAAALRMIRAESGRCGSDL